MSNQSKSWREILGAQYFTHHKFYDDDTQFAVEVERVDIKEIEPGVHKPVLFFTAFDKPLILNVTNCMNMEWATGTDDIAQWKREKITLYKDKTTYEGETLPCVRIRPYSNEPGGPTCEKKHAEALQEFETVGRERYNQAWDERKQKMVRNYMKTKLSVEDVSEPEKIGIPALEELTNMMLEAATKPNEQSK